MSGKVSGWVWDIELDHAEAWVLMALADHAEHDGTKVYPSVSRLVWKTGYSRTYVKEVLKRLRDVHEILVLVKKGGGRGNPNEYRIDMTAGKPKKTYDEWMKETGNCATPSEKGQKGHSEAVKGSVQSDPETSFLETSGSRRGAKAPSEAPKRANDYMDELMRRFKPLGIVLDDQQRAALSGNLNRLLMKHDATPLEMEMVVNRLADRWPKAQISPQKALSYVRGEEVGKPSGAGEAEARGTPDAALRAIRADRDFAPYARVAEVFDFTSGGVPGGKWWFALGGHDRERGDNAAAMTSVARRAMREAEAG